MALPDSELPEDLDIKQDIDVFDMQAFQEKEVSDILKDSPSKVNPAMAGYVLSGHEAFTQKVATENIICAVKCKRSDFAFIAQLPVFIEGKNYVFCQNRYFEINPEVYVNDKYTQDETYKNRAITQLHEVKGRGLQPTANVQDALDECGIAYDKKNILNSSYFWIGLKSFHFGMACFSLLESIYHAVIQFCKFVTEV